MLEINNLNFSYGGKPIHKGLCLRVKKNQYFALAGLNGAGKTTLVKLILDLLRTQSENEILIEGKSSWLVTSRKNIMYLPEKFRLSPNVTAMDYFKLLAGVYGQKLNTEGINQLAEKLGFDQDALNRKAHRYSKGMTQKVGLIGSLSVNASLLLLDEPLSGLDPKARLQVKQLMLEQKEQNKTVLYSTHMLADVEEICDSFGILHDGVLKFEGTPRQCMNTYKAKSLEESYMRCIDQ